MASQMSFKDLAEQILKKYPDTSLPMRWKEATISDPDPKPSAFWVRESNDLLNIVWLTDSDVRDITWFPDIKVSTLIILRYSAITGFQVRESIDVGRSHELNVSGNYLVSVYSKGEHGGLYWVASNRKEEEELRDFVAEFAKKFG